MDKKIIKGLIEEKLEVIQEQFSIVREYEGKIPVIELDLIMANIRDLYELLLSLQIENMGSVMPKPSSQPGIPEPAQPAEHAAPAVPAAPESPAAPATPVRPSPGIISMEPVAEQPETSEAPPPPEPDPEPEIQAYKDIEQESDKSQPAQKFQRSTYDLFSENGEIFADRLRDGQDRRFAGNPDEIKNTDLKTSIGINEKFLFINELFEGNMRIYDEAIQKLNASATVAQADLLLLDLKIVYNWDSESPTVKKFVELVRKKF